MSGEDYRDGYDDGYAAGAKEQEGGVIGLVILCGLCMLVGLGVGFWIGHA